jgi:kexin
LALALSVRPDLNWRDLQHLTIRASVPVSLDDPDWQMTHAGRNYSHKYGYGRLDAGLMVEGAKTWVSVRPQTNYTSEVKHESLAIPEGSHGLKSSIDVTAAQLNQSHLARLEHVTITLNLTHACRGDLDIWLISPHGVRSNIGPRRGMDVSSEGYKNWTFMSVKHWEEDPVGTWTLHVVDDFNAGKAGILHHWQLGLFGEIAADVPVSPSAPGNEKEGDPSKSSTKTTLLFLLGIVVVGCIGMYLMWRNIYSPYAMVKPNEQNQRGILDPIELEVAFVLEDSSDEEGTNADALSEPPTPKYETLPASDPSLRLE